MSCNNPKCLQMFADWALLVPSLKDIQQIKRLIQGSVKCEVGRSHGINKPKPVLSDLN